MIDFPDGLDDLSSADALDMAALGFGLEVDGIGQQQEADDEEPTINPFQDMDSLDFHLWMMEEVEKEHQRRQEQAAKAAKAAEAPAADGKSAK